MIVAAVPALRLSRRFGTSLRGGEEKALAAVAANRNNPTFKNRRNPKETKEKTFSNRNKTPVSVCLTFATTKREVACRSAFREGGSPLALSISRGPA